MVMLQFQSCESAVQHFQSQHVLSLSTMSYWVDFMIADLDGVPPSDAITHGHLIQLWNSTYSFG
jgi:hypothetical protein